MKITARIVAYKQGTIEWEQHRAASLNASELAAAMGLSPYLKRADLIRQRATGVTPEIDAPTARRFAQGHEFEAIARDWAEELIDDSLYPIVLSADVEGLPLSASLDGHTLDGGINFEHKTGNAGLLASLEAGVIPEQYHPQMEQGLMLSGATRCLFMASSGDREAMRFAWYESRPELRAQIIPTWRRFLADVAAFKAEPAAEPAPTGKAPDTLPALRIEVTGAVTASNLAEFKATALAAIRGVNRELKTDADFADADKAVKWCADVESRLKAAKEHALSQTADIDALFKTLDDISAEARTVRLDLGKLVTRRKEEVKEHAVLAARKALDAHIADLNGELAPMRLQPVAADFPGAIKGLRSIASMQDALDTALANGKIAADAQARNIRANIAAFKVAADGLEFLFSDLGLLVHKAGDDFAAAISNRIASHRAAEAAKEARRKADEEARIAAAVQKAEADRLAREAREAEERRQAAVRAELEAQRLRVVQQQPVAVLPVAQCGVAENPVQPQPDLSPGDAAVDRAAAGMSTDSVGPVAAPNVIAANEPAILKLGDIAARLGFTLSSDFIGNTLKVTAAGAERGLPRFTEGQFVQIVHALQNHLTRVLNQRKAA